MDDDFEISINSNVLSIKSPTAKQHINNNDVTLLNNNTLNNAAKCNKNETIMPMSSQQANNPNYLMSTSNSNMNADTTVNGNDALQNRLAFTSQKMMNSRVGVGNTIAVDCFENDTADGSIKEEPLSPDSSCPPSPNASTSSSILDGANQIIVTQSAQQNNAASQFGTINVNLGNVAYTNADLLFEHNKVNSNLLT